MDNDGRQGLAQHNSQRAYQTQLCKKIDPLQKIAKGYDQSSSVKWIPVPQLLVSQEIN